MPLISEQQHQELMEIQAETDKKEAEYWVKLGQFIEAYALTEYFLFHLLCKQAGVSMNIGKALFSGSRTDGTIQLIKRIWEVKDPGEKVRKELMNAFTQLKAINDVRNVAVHHGRDGHFVSTSRMALTPERVNKYRMSTKILDQMCIDLHKINIHLLINSWSLKRTRHDAAIRRSSWRYKPRPNQNQSAKKPDRKDRG